VLILGEDVGKDGGEVISRAGEVAVALVATPIQEQFDRGDAAPKLRRLIAKRWYQDVIRCHRAGRTNTHRLLAERIAVRIEVPGEPDAELGHTISGHALIPNLPAA
jgi:hypothetical protein